MIIFRQVLEMVHEPIKKIRGIAERGEYVEIRFKPKLKSETSSIYNFSLDVRISSCEGKSMRMIYQQNMMKDLSLEEIIEYLEIKFIKEGTDADKENSGD